MHRRFLASLLTIGLTACASPSGESPVASSNLATDPCDALVNGTKLAFPAGVPSRLQAGAEIDIPVTVTRPPEASHWNVLSSLTVDHLSHAD